MEPGREWTECRILKQWPKKKGSPKLPQVSLCVKVPHFQLLTERPSLLQVWSKPQWRGAPGLWRGGQRCMTWVFFSFAPCPQKYTRELSELSFLNIYFLIEGKLFYNACHTTTWISHNYTDIASLFELPPLPSLLQVITEGQAGLPVLDSSFPWLFTHDSVYMPMILSQCIPPLSSPAVSTSSLFVPWSPSLQTGSTDFIHMYTKIFSSDLRHSITGSLGLSTSLQLIQIRILFKYYNILSCICTSSVSIHLSMDI